MNNIELLAPTRETLLNRLRDGQDHESWQDFFEIYWRLIYGMALKFGLSDAEAQDVVQETVISVHQKIPEFKYDPKKGSFKSWLFTLTRWRILDHLRKKKSGNRLSVEDPNDSRATPLVERIPDESNDNLERIWDREWNNNLLQVATARIRRQVDARQFQIFDLYVVNDCPVAEVMKLLNVSRTQVYLAKHRISKMLKSEIEKLESVQH